MWTADTQAGIAGGPASYAIDGEQYVAVVAAGQPASAAYWAPNYCAPAGVQARRHRRSCREAVAFVPPPLNPPAEFGDAAQLERGDSQYTAHCAGCHGNNAPGGRAVSSLFPDLRYAGALWSADAFKAIVIDGALQQNGMVSFERC